MSEQHQQYKPGSLNSVMAIGRVTMQPELRYTPSGAAVMNFRIAINRRYKDKTTDEWKEEVNYVGVVAWSQLAERLSETMQKGDAVMVEGSLKSRDWETKGGDKRSIVEVQARRVQVLTRHDAHTEPAAGEHDNGGDEPAAAPHGDALDDIPF